MRLFPADTESGVRGTDPSFEGSSRKATLRLLLSTEPKPGAAARSDLCGAIDYRLSGDGPECHGAVSLSFSQQPRIAGAHGVDVGGKPLGELWIRDLEHVLGVRLARAGEVERAHEDGVVGDGHL